MDLLRTAANPWGQEVLVGISWDLMWLAIAASAAFVVGHALWVRTRPGAAAPQDDAAVASAGGVPERLERHSRASRAFHWLMAVAMLVLLVTAFGPALGWEFAWLELHWIAGLVLIATLVYHVIHALGWQDFWAIWMGREDVREVMAELRRALSPEPGPAPKSGKYPADQKLYHHMAAAASLVAAATGLLMMIRIDTPLWSPNPYVLSDGAWGVVYVLHGLSGVALIGLVAAHIYFAVRPEKRWMTWSMLRGWITREHYLAHFDPQRWVAAEVSASEPLASGGGAGAEPVAGAPRRDD